MAFLFNWIGFFLSFCLTTSAAGRYGAISGFGLSLIKWVLIVRVRTVHWKALSTAASSSLCTILCKNWEICSFSQAVKNEVYFGRGISFLARNSSAELPEVLRALPLQNWLFPTSVTTLGLNSSFCLCKFVAKVRIFFLTNAFLCEQHLGFLFPWFCHLRVFICL